MNRKKIILVALVGVLSLCLLYAFYATPRQKTAPPRKVERGATKVKAIKKNAQALVEGEVHLSLLEVEPEPFAGAKRDIFQFKQRQRKIVPKVEKIADKEPEKVPEPPVPVLPTPVEQMQQALGKFTFLGFLEKSGEKTVFLSSGGELFVVKAGETFGARKEFEVVSIEGNLLKVSSFGQDTLVEVQLVEQQQLSATISAPAKIETREQPQASSPNIRQPRTFTPSRRVTRPVSPRRSGSSPTGVNNEDNSVENQELDFTERGDDLEGDVDGSNQ